jgi:hypothetical protein
MNPTLNPQVPVGLPREHLPRRALLRGLAAGALGATAVLAGCKGAGPLLPSTVRITQEELTRSIGERFPIDRRLLEIVNITIANPRLLLRPAENRLASEFEVTALDSFFAQRALKGSLRLNYALRYETSDGSVRLSQVRVEQFLFDGVPEVLRRRLDRVGSVLGEQMLEDMVVHRVNPQRLQQARDFGLQPGQPRVVDGGVEIPLERIAAR